MTKKKIIKTPFKEPFVIYQLPKPQNLRDFSIREKNKFISPVFGNDVKDEIVVPNPVKIEGDFNKRFGVFNPNKKLSEEEIKQKYGSKYYEFTNFIDSKTRERVYGSNNNEYNYNNNNNNNNNRINNNNENLANFEQNIHNEPSAVSPYVNAEIKPVEDDSHINTYDKDDYTNEYSNDYPNTNDSVKTNALKPKYKPQLKDTTGVIKRYQFPDISLYHKHELDLDSQPEWLLEQINIIDETLLQFGINGRVVGTKKGPTVTRYEVALDAGINVKKVTQIQQNLEMNLSARQMRIEAPIPGKPYVGIEVPNQVAETVYFGNVVDQKEFLEDHGTPLKVALGVDIDGENIYVDLAKMPHGLIAGSTGSGKSVCVNTILISLLLKNTPEDLRLILIDPKRVELNTYYDIPHLITPVVDDKKMAVPVLNWAVDEMEKRYSLFAQSMTRDIKSFNDKISRGVSEQQKIPYIVIIIDELADLLLEAPVEIEDAIQKITQKARAAGIHLLIATQRPSADVVKGTIKTNIPARMAFKVSSHFDSNTILDGIGAEKLLGRGDMLLKEGDSIHRLQAAFISNEEIDRTTNFIRSNNETNYVFLHEDLKQQVSTRDADNDELFEAAAYFIVDLGSASINGLQKEFGLGFNRAQNLALLLEKNNIISSSQGTKPRDVLVTRADLDDFFGKSEN